MTPNQQVLSDEQVSAAWTVGTDGDAYIDPLLMRFARAIESATLAALAQQAQEPVAWLYVDTVGERYLCFSRPTGGGAITNLYATPPAPQPALVDELPDLNPEDFVVDVVLKQLGGFAPVTTHGVRVTHKPSRVSVVVDSERSQHQNRQLALEALRAIIRPQDHPVPAPSPQAPGRRKGPPGITLEPHGHEPPAVPGVSDEQIRKTVEAVQDPDTVPAFHNGYYTLTPGELRRVILTLRPAVEPMTPFTPSQRMRLWQNTEKGKSATSLGAFERICQTVEAAHRIGITAKAEDAHQPTKEDEK